MPYIISTRSNWANCKLRVFCTEAGHDDLNKEKEGSDFYFKRFSFFLSKNSNHCILVFGLYHRMAELLTKFRINYSDLIMLPDIDKSPKESTKTWFEGLFRHFDRKDEITGKNKSIYH